MRLRQILRITFLHLMRALILWRLLFRSFPQSRQLQPFDSLYQHHILSYMLVEGLMWTYTLT